MFVHFESGEGFCNAEMINNVSWPETPSGSGAVVITCPGNKRRNVTRRCVNATWSIADYNTCLQFSDIPVSNHAILYIAHNIIMCTSFSL